MNASFSLLSRDTINKFLIAISVNKWLLFPTCIYVNSLAEWYQQADAPE